MRTTIVWTLCIGALATAACTADPVPSALATPTPTPSGEESSVGELETARIPLESQPATLLFDRGTLWVGGSVLLRVEDDRVVDRFDSEVTRVKLARVGSLLWATGGGDGGVPDGTLVAYDATSGDVVDRRVFPDRSPYGMDASGKGLFVALFQGDLLRITDDVTSSVRLSDGLTQVLVAHGKVWVSAPQTGKVWRVVFDGSDDASAVATAFPGYPKRTCPQGLESSSDAIWVTDPCARRVWLLDPRNGEVMDWITGIGRPVDVSIHSGLAWTVSLRSKLVTVLDEETLNVVARGHAGKGAIAIAAHGDDAWVANHEDNSLTHLRLR